MAVSRAERDVYTVQHVAGGGVRALGNAGCCDHERAKEQDVKMFVKFMSETVRSLNER